MRTIEDIALHIERNIKNGTIIGNVEILSAELEKTIDFYINVAKKLDVQDAIKAMDYIFGQCLRAKSKIVNATDSEVGLGCLYPIYEAEFDSYYVKNEDRILEFAEKKGLVRVVNGTFGKCLKQVSLPFEITYDIWEADYYKEHFPNIAPIINVISNGKFMADSLIGRLLFEYDFLVKAGVYSEESTDKYKVFSDFIDCKDEKIVELLSTRISSYTAPKSIAITLMAMIKLGYINIDKINRRELYRSIQRINNTTFNDSSINYYVSLFISQSLSYPISNAIEIEAEAIKKLLV